MKLTSMIAVIICLLTLGAGAQKKGYTITGNIKDLPDGIIFYLIKSNEEGGADTVSRVKSKGQGFVLKGSLTEEGIWSFIKMDTSIVKLTKGKDSWIRLLLDHSNIVLSGDLKQWPEVNIIGSHATQDYDKIDLVLMPLKKQYSERVAKTQNDARKQAEIYKEYNLEYTKVLQSISGSYALPFFIFNNSAFELADFEGNYNKLPGKLKDSYYGKKLKQHIYSTKLRETVNVGKPIPDFKVKNPDGKIESVKELAMKSKYTLVDFWAYWCKPCRADIPDMKKVYNAFKDKGFNIISVSTDQNDVQWKKALKEENTPWVNGMQQGNVSKDVFGITAIPGYILLNEKAEIVQMDMVSILRSKLVGTINGMQMYQKQASLRGDDLYKTMEELLGKAENK